MLHDPGGKVRIAIGASVVDSSAVFGGDRQEYRYRLQRGWGDGPLVMFLMMNPSTADIRVDDPTVAKCTRLARKWGYGGLLVGNVFAYRATDQNELARVKNPEGPLNSVHLAAMARQAAMIVCAYGTPRVAALRPAGLLAAQRIAIGGHPLHVLRLSKHGVPYHPLYLPESLTPIPWTPPEPTP
jgi:hypothetical protein